MSEINAIRFAEPWQVSCVKIPMPEPKPGEALIKIMAAGICGSDIGAFRGTNGLVSYPRVIGHELAGVVVSIPENNKNGIKVGDRVKKGDLLCYIEAMKTYNAIRSDVEGTVTAICLNSGDSVSEDDVLMKIG